MYVHVCMYVCMYIHINAGMMDTLVMSPVLPHRQPTYVYVYVCMFVCM